MVRLLGAMRWLLQQQILFIVPEERKQEAHRAGLQHRPVTFSSHGQGTVTFQLYSTLTKGDGQMVKYRKFILES